MRSAFSGSRRLLPIGLLLMLAAGCGSGPQPVRGKVTLDDGSPVTKGMVVFESLGGDPKITARGDIQPDGSFQLGTYKPGDGVPPGKYRVLVAPREDMEDIDSPNRKPAAFDPRYSDFKTSGLECEVKSGTNEYPIQVSRPKKGRG
jgi:hypothetical protein